MYAVGWTAMSLRPPAHDLTFVQLATGHIGISLAVSEGILDAFLAGD